MKYLLDTHILLWTRLDPDKLTASQRTILSDHNTQKYISSLSMWEISLKYSLGKLTLGSHTPEEFLTSLLSLRLEVLEPTTEQFASFYRLPTVIGHKDPFDRMLIWQAIQSNVTLLSADRKLADYRLHGLLLA